MQMGAKDITVHSRLTVVPSKPTPSGKVHKLSLLDHMMQKHFLRAVYYYDASSVEERPKLLESLKESLCKALSTYPLFAGRLQKREDGFWEVKFNDAGVRIYEANCAFSMQDFMAKSLHSGLESELCRNEINPDHTITPVAVIQVFFFFNPLCLCSSLICCIWCLWFSIVCNCTHSHAYMNWRICACVVKRIYRRVYTWHSFICCCLACFAMFSCMQGMHVSLCTCRIDLKNDQMSTHMYTFALVCACSYTSMYVS